LLLVNASSFKTNKTARPLFTHKVNVWQSIKGRDKNMNWIFHFVFTTSFFLWKNFDFLSQMSPLEVGGGGQLALMTTPARPSLLKPSPVNSYCQDMVNFKRVLHSHLIMCKTDRATYNCVGVLSLLQCPNKSLTQQKAKFPCVSSPSSQVIDPFLSWTL
jgi:hypothetical protein